MTDFQILGIEVTQDLTVIKSAFRKRIKEIHPDHCPEVDAFKNHLLFIQVNQAYSRLVGSFGCDKDGKPRGTEFRMNEPVPMPTAENATALVKSKDPSYAFYKTGMKFFMAIHPSKWNDESQLQVPIKGDTSKEQEELRMRVKELIKLFPKAYYYFSIVVHEYPQSIWAPDAREKMALIEERTRMYKKIIESFGLLAPDNAPRRPITRREDMVF